MNKTFSNFNTGISKDLELISSEGTVAERKFLFLKERKHLLLLLFILSLYTVCLCVFFDSQLWLSCVTGQN